MRALSNVTRVLTNPEGTRAIGVEYYDARKERQVQEASVVVLAAWSAQNPRILLNSVTDKHPKGLANKNELVGKFMMTHHIAGTWALFDEDITPHMGTVGAQYMSYDRYAKTSYPNAFGSSFIAVGTSHKTNDYAQARGDLFGPELAAYMKRAARGLTHLTIFGEDLPNAENRIELISDKDEYGLPMARLIHSFDDDAVALWNANFEQGLKIAKATDAKESWPGKGPVMPTAHLHGGAIMGKDSSELGDQQLWPDPRDSQSVDGRAVRLPDRGRIQPDLHDLRRGAARRRALGGALGECGGLDHPPPR